MDDVENGLLAFLAADQDIKDLIQTPPDPVRFFPNAAPQRVPPTDLHVVYYKDDTAELDALAMGPCGLPVAVIVLECRQQSASPKQATLLARRIRRSKGHDPNGRKLDGFAGTWPGGYVVQKAKVRGPRHEYVRPVKAGELGTHVVVLEVTVAFNNLL